MSTPRILDRLHSLDTSSLDFSRHLYCLIQYDEEEKYLTMLEGPELAQLVNFLDEVRAIPPAFHQYTKRTPQALSALPTTDGVARECLHKLQAICGRHGTLPPSCIISGEIIRVGNAPIAFGDIADLWKGAHGGKKVSVGCLKVRMDDDQTLQKVRVRYDMSVSFPLENTYGHCSHSLERSFCGKG